MRLSARLSELMILLMRSKRPPSGLPETALRENGPEIAERVAQVPGDRLHDEGGPRNAGPESRGELLASA